MTVDASKLTGWLIQGPPKDNASVSKLTGWMIVRPATAAHPRRQRPKVRGQIIKRSASL